MVFDSKRTTSRTENKLIYLFITTSCHTLCLQRLRVSSIKYFLLVNQTQMKGMRIQRKGQSTYGRVAFKAQYYFRIITNLDFS